MSGKEIQRRAKSARGEVIDRQERMDGDSDGPSSADLERFGGVTVKCKHCDSELFDDAAVCWNCGKVVLGDAENNGIPKWAILMALALVAMFVLFLTWPVISR